MSRKYGKGMYPPPVYEATFKDGSTARMSFYSEQGKPIDFGDGRRLLATVYGRPRDESGFVTVDGRHKLADLKNRWEHLCRHVVPKDGGGYESCGYSVTTDNSEAPGPCPKCGADGLSARFAQDAGARIDHLVVFPPAELVDGWVELADGTRLHDPHFSGEQPAPPPRKGKTGAALVQQVLRQLDRDDSREARRAVELLRREFWPELEGVAA